MSGNQCQKLLVGLLGIRIRKFFSLMAAHFFFKIRKSIYLCLVHFNKGGCSFLLISEFVPFSLVQIECLCKLSGHCSSITSNYI